MFKRPYRGFIVPRQAVGGWGQHSGPISRPISPKKNFKKSKPKKKRAKRRIRRINPIIDRSEEIFRETHVVREFTDLDGSKFAAWVPKDTSDKEALNAAFENSLAGHREGQIKEKLFEIMLKRLEQYGNC